MRRTALLTAQLSVLAPLCENTVFALREYRSVIATK